MTRARRVGADCAPLGAAGALLRATGALLRASGALVCAAHVLHAQQVPASVTIAPAMQNWSFATPLQQDSNQVRRASQLVLPVSVIVPLGDRWTFDASGAMVQGTVDVDRPGGSASLSLNGLTDVRMRLLGRLVGDRVLFTLGATAPSGKTRLAGDALDAARVIGAPALRMPAPLLGTGAGVSAGIVLATQAGSWALAAGGAYEKRGSYTPIEASIAGVTTSTDLRPGAMMHFTLGADRLLGENRLSLLAAADMYAADEVSASGNGSAASGTYQLGPSYTVLAALDIGAAAFRELRITVSDRFRTAFKGLDGLTAPGSSGSYLDLSARGVLGRPGRVGLILGVDAHHDSGLAVDNTFATASMSTAGFTLGLALPAGGYTLQPFARVQTGNIDTGLGSSTMRGLSVGIAMSR